MVIRIQLPFPVSQVFLTLPGEADSYTIRCAMNHEPSEDNHTVEVHIVEQLNVTKNELNTTIKYDNGTGDNCFIIDA